MKILDLSLTYHWYDEIASGRKKEEYRKMKPFYHKRFIEKVTEEDVKFVPFATTHCAMAHPRHYDAVRFHRGQGSLVTMLVECLGISVGYGKPEWGADPNECVYIISLGRILSGTSGAQLHSCKE